VGGYQCRAAGRISQDERVSDEEPQGFSGAKLCATSFLGEADEAQVRAADPGSAWDRLRQIKAKYDPTNRFRLNQNIKP
jgi:Berberine and berberine like